jgi:hypothetical protein
VVEAHAVQGLAVVLERAVFVVEWREMIEEGVRDGSTARAGREDAERARRAR